MKVIKFSATWCGPCKVYAPFFDKVAEMEEFNGITFEKIDVEDEGARELCEKYKITSVPTTIILDDDGNVIRKFSGIMSVLDLTSIIKQNKNG